MVDTRECWEWGGYKDRDGYGRKGLDGGMYSTHRLALAWSMWDAAPATWYGGFDNDWKKAIPEGALVLHHCDNPACCNPDHLYLGTNADNARDRTERGRWRGGAPRGEDNPASKVTAEDVKRIRAQRGARKSKEVALEYGLSSGTVRKIWRREKWAWLQ